MLCDHYLLSFLVVKVNKNQILFQFYRMERVTDDDLRKCSNFIDTMKVLYTCTLAISSEKIPTVGQILPLLMKLKDAFQVTDTDSDFTKSIKSAVRINLENRYQVSIITDGKLVEKVKQMDEGISRYFSQSSNLVSSGNPRSV